MSKSFVELLEVTAAKSPNMSSHINKGRAYQKAENEFCRKAVAWHHSVAKQQLNFRQTAIKTGQHDRAADYLKLHEHHKNLANAIDDGKLKPGFTMAYHPED